MRTRIGISMLLCLVGITGIFAFARPASAESTFYVSSSALYTTTGTSTSSPQTGTSTVVQSQLDKPYKNPKKYLAEKYAVHVEDIYSTLKETSLGITGKFTFKGRFFPKNQHLSIFFL